MGMNDSSPFQCDSFVRGYHVYINIWETLVGECLKSRKEPTNELDKTAVAMTRIVKKWWLGKCQRICPRLYLCSYPCPIVLWTSL